MTDKTTIVLAFANAENDLTGLQKEKDQLISTLTPLEEKSLIRLVVIEDASVDKIFNKLNAPEFKDTISIFHFSGHANSLHLLLERDGEVQMAKGEGLMPFLASQDSLKLVFLNACSTAEHQKYFADKQKVVVATSSKVGDQIAVDFASNFYKCLASAYNIAESFSRAEQYIQTTHNEKDYRSFEFSWEEDTTDTENTEEVFAWKLYDTKITNSKKMLSEWKFIKTKSPIRALLEKDKLKQALQELYDYCKVKDPELANDVSMMQNQLSSQKRKIRKRIISEEDAEIERQKIGFNILEILAELDD